MDHSDSTCRVLFLPARVWLVLPLLMLLQNLALWTLWPPRVPEPFDRDELNRELVCVTRDGDSFRIVPYAQSRGVEPLWMVASGWGGWNGATWKWRFMPILGLFRLTGHWEYWLNADRYSGVGDAANPVSLPRDEMAKVRPVVVAELNRRHPGSRLGDRLEGVLAGPVETDTWVCPQNAAILVSWLSVPMAALALAKIRLARRRPARPERRPERRP